MKDIHTIESPKMKPISLTDEQLAIVRGYVSNVLPRWQRRYLNGVSVLLAREVIISNRVVPEVCADTARAMMVGGGAAPVLGDDD
jgi:hypothetical protein